MQPPPTIFREYDIRGIVGPELDADGASRIARAFGTYARRAGARRAAAGHDNRASSEILYAAALRGLTDAGCDVDAIGLALTPMLYFAQRHLGAEAGIMVTASHNPPEFNGFKLAFGPGTLYGAQIQEIRELAASAAAGDERPGRVVARPVAGAYMDMLAERIRLGPRRLRVGLDCGNGTAAVFVPEMLRRWGCEVVELYCDSDPTFPHHHPDPVDPHNLTDLIALVRSAGLDLGIGIDGDGDRLGVVDDTGGILWGDLLMALFWREILPKYPGAVGLVEVKCSQALVDEIRRLGGRPEFTRTGHSLIKARMREVGAVFTGEMSGHLFFADEYFGYDDAVYAAGRLLRLLSGIDRPLSRLAAEIPRYYSTPEIRVACPDEQKFRVVEDVTRDLRSRYEVIDVDGARVILPDGWALVRASNTQPVLVVRAEGRTPAALEAAKAVVDGVLRRHPEVGPICWA